MAQDEGEGRLSILKWENQLIFGGKGFAGMFLPWSGDGGGVSNLGVDITAESKKHLEI